LCGFSYNNRRRRRIEEDQLNQYPPVGNGEANPVGNGEANLSRSRKKTVP